MKRESAEKEGVTDPIGPQTATYEYADISTIRDVTQNEPMTHGIEAGYLEMRGGNPGSSGYEDIDITGQHGAQYSGLTPRPPPQPTVYERLEQR